jgi:MoxR-like ATPase
MVQRRLARGSAPPASARRVTGAELLAMRASVEQVRIDPDLLRYVVELVGATRAHPQVLVGASPRGTLAIVQLARARAVVDGRDFVIPEDIREVTVPALGHRLSLRPELWVRGVTGDDIVNEVMRGQPVPRADVVRR